MATPFDRWLSGSVNHASWLAAICSAAQDVPDVENRGVVSLKRYTIYNLTGAVIPTGIGLITVPLYLHVLGTEKFGALSTIWIICGSLGFFDLGLTKALAYSVAKFGSDDSSRGSRIIATGLLIAAISATFATFVAYLLARWYFGDLFKANPALIAEIRHALPLVALTAGTSVLLGVITGALQGSRKFLQANIFVTAMAASLQIGPLIIFIAPIQTLDIMMTSTLVLRVISVGFGLVVIRWRIPRGVFRPSRSEIRPLLSFGRWTMGISFAGPIILFADKFLLGALVGANAVAFYSIPFQLAQRITLIPKSVGSALLPDLTVSDPSRQSALTTRATVYIYLFVTLPCFVGVLFSSNLLGWWLGIAIDKQLTFVTGVLIVAFWINCLGQIYHISLVTMNRPHIVFNAMLTEILIYLPVLYFLTYEFGMIGAAISFLLLCFCDAIALFALSHLKNRHFNMIMIEFGILGMGVAMAVDGYGFGLMSFFAVLLAGVVIAFVRRPVLSTVGLNKIWRR